MITVGSLILIVLIFSGKGEKRGEGEDGRQLLKVDVSKRIMSYLQDSSRHVQEPWFRVPEFVDWLFSRENQVLFQIQNLYIHIMYIMYQCYELPPLQNCVPLLVIRHRNARKGVPGHEPPPFSLLDQFLPQHLPHRGPVQLGERDRSLREMPRNGLQVWNFFFLCNDNCNSTKMSFSCSAIVQVGFAGARISCAPLC